MKVKEGKKEQLAVELMDLGYPEGIALIGRRDHEMLHWPLQTSFSRISAAPQRPITSLFIIKNLNGT